MSAEDKLSTWQGVLAFGRLFAKQPALSTSVLFLTLLGILTDGLGLLMLIPLLGTLTGSGAENTVSEKLSGLWDMLGLEPTLSGILAVFLSLLALRAAIRLGKDWASVRLRTTLIDYLRNDAVAALMNAEWRWLSNQKRSDQTNMVLTEVQRVGTGIQASLTLLANLAAVLAYLGVAFAMEPLITFIVTAIGGLMLAIFSGHRKKAMQLGIQQITVNKALHEQALESVGAVKMVKILGRETGHVENFNQAAKDLRENQLHLTMVSSVSRELFQFTGAVFLVSYIFMAVSVGHVDVSELLVLIFIFARLVPMLTTAQQFLQMLLNALPALTEAQMAIREARLAAEPRPVHMADMILVDNVIELESVSIQFSGHESPALMDISLSLPRNSTTVISGPSGSGKSTLADVLMGLLVPDQGRMLLDGVPLAGPDRINWRRAVSYVPQDVKLYNGTVRENVLNARPDATDDEVMRALEAASADFVHRLPKGLDTRIGDGAQVLSGGEAQRIALARGLLRNPSLLVLDEVTSALDPTNEARIVESVTALSGNMTIVILGHRTGFTKIADQLIQLNEGRIVHEKASI